MTVRIVHARGVVTGDGPSIVDGAVVLEGARVRDVGPATDVLRRSAGATVERFEGVVFPGLVNAHTHLELSCLAGIPRRGLGFAGWAREMLAARRETSPEDAARGVRRGVSALVASGTVAVGDVTNGLSAVRALAEAGIVGAVFHEVFGAVREGVLATVSGLLSEARSAGALDAGGLAWSPSAHTLHTTHPDAVRALVGLARERGTRTSLHLAEHSAERMALRDGTGPMISFLRALGVPDDAFPWPGEGPVAYAASLGALGPDVVLVHLADATPEELDRVAETGTHVVVCPRSNAYIEGNRPDVPGMLARGIAPALGTDSLASSDSLDVLDEAAEVVRLFPDVGADAALSMATTNGAKALGLEALGRVREGAMPGLFGVEGELLVSPAAFLLERREAPRVRLDRAKGALR